MTASTAYGRDGPLEGGASVQDRTVLAGRRDLLVRAWEHAHATEVGQDLPTGPRVAASVLASWRRSASTVSRDVEAAPLDGADEALARWRATPTAAALDLVVNDLRSVVSSADLIAAVTDDAGRIVWTHGSRVMQRSAARVNFVPGGRWDEQSVGTNALALALRTGAPSTVYSAEHFSRAVHGWVCYSVPLINPGGAVIGVLDLSTTWDRAHPLVLGTAQVLGRLLISAMPRPQPVPTAHLELTALGAASVRCAGQPLLLPHRQIEVLTLLVLHPAGLSLEQLHAHLYGDEPVALASLKAEVSHLRTALQGAIGSRPYRLTGPVTSDVQRLLTALDEGDTATAVRLASAPLLPASHSPGLEQWRRYVEVALHSAVLRTTEVSWATKLADLHPQDEQLQQHLLDVLPAGDPRQAQARARLDRARADLV